MTKEEFKNLKEGDIIVNTFRVVRYTDDVKTSVITNRKYANSETYNPDHFNFWDYDTVYLELGEKVSIEELEKAKAENDELKKRIAEMADKIDNLEQEIKMKIEVMQNLDRQSEELIKENKQLLCKHEELSNDARTKMCLDWAIDMAKVLKNDKNEEV